MKAPRAWERVDTARAAGATMQYLAGTISRAELELELDLLLVETRRELELRRGETEDAEREPAW